jgi:glycosyltransferase involved in cell wall biosynthesis
MKGLSVIVPVFNEENSIDITIKSLRSVLASQDFKWEIIAINDGSNDSSPELLEKIDGISIHSNKRNRGYGASLKLGLRKATYDSVCITDADGTYPFDKIPDMYSLLVGKKYDMVVGARTGANVSYPFLKKIPKFFITKLANYISGHRIPDINSGLRLFDKDLAMEFYHMFPDGFSFTTTITMGMLCNGYEVEYFPIDYFKREGKSKISPIKDTIRFVQLLLRISLYFKPFKFFNPIIWVFAFISMFFLARDIFYLKDLTQGSVFFPIMTLLFFSLSLMADLIIKRSR